MDENLFIYHFNDTDIINKIPKERKKLCILIEKLVG